MELDGHDLTDPKNYAAIFEDDARGAAILQDLVERFSKPAVTRGGIDAVLATYHRMGEKAVVNFIVDRCNETRGVKSASDASFEY